MIALLAMTMVLFAGMTVALPSVKAGTAQVPIWNEGDGWAVGKSADLDVEFAQAIENATNQIQSMLNHSGIVRDFSLTSFSLEASGGVWLLFKVVAVSDTEYHLRATAAMKFTASLDVKASYEFPRAGTYDYSTAPGDSAYEQHSATGALKIDMAMVVNFDLYLQKSNAAVKKVTSDFKGSLAVKIDATNILDFTRDEAENTITVRYIDYHVSGLLDVFASVAVDFTPALNLYDFPINVGDEWDIDSNATLTGSMGGTLDIKGLPDTGLLANVEGEIFESEVLQEAGITSFPIDLSKLAERDEEPVIHNGVITPVTERIQAHMKCESNKTVNFPQWGDVEVWNISVNGTEGLIWVSDQRFWTSFEDIADEMGIPFDPSALPDDIPADMMDMPEVTVGQAEQEINEISDYRADITSPAGTGISTDLLMILLVVAVVAVVAVVLAFVLMRKKPKVQ